MEFLTPALELGAHYLGDNRCRFRVWAPVAQRVEVCLLGPTPRIVPLEREAWGYHAGELDDVAPGARYRYRLYGRIERPDPASRSQPLGVHGPSEVVDLRFAWTDQAWRGLPLVEQVFYELHVGTFTAQGTLDAAIEQLDDLHALGITTIELMPLAQFPGDRNWGYDGVYPFAVQNSYGGPLALQRFVDAAHYRGLAVMLDVVHNHLGPEGNYLADFGPYFSDRFRTPWGPAINLEGPHSDPVRAMFIANSLYWIETFHLDGLRLDAVHALVDRSINPFLRELTAAVQQRASALGRAIHLVAESNQNDARLTRPIQQQGLGLDGQWNDDFHHALHAALTGETGGYYIDFGSLAQLVKAISQGFVLTGQHSYYRHRRWGLPGDTIPRGQLIVAAQNHDQVGNRREGERLSTLVDFESLKLAAAATLLSPFVPLLFMGEEYGDPSPFLYFVSHGDPELIANVREGRKRDFASFQWQDEPPDPQSPETFYRSQLQHQLRELRPKPVAWQFHQQLLRLRKSIPALASLDNIHVTAGQIAGAKIVYYAISGGPKTNDRSAQLQPTSLVLLNFNTVASAFDMPRIEQIETAVWLKRLDSADRIWNGPGELLPSEIKMAERGLRMPPRSAAMFVGS